MTRSVIGFNAMSLQPNGSGVQTYITELLKALDGEMDADRVATVCYDSLGELPPGVRRLVRKRQTGLRRLMTEARRIPSADLAHGLDVQIPICSSVPTVATIHDMAVFDVPWAFSKRWAVRHRAITAHAVTRADVVIAVSNFTAERISSRFGRDSTVVPEAPAPDFQPPGNSLVLDIRRAYDLPPIFVGCVATIEPRKDVATLAAACRNANIPLVLAGGAQRPPPSGARHLGYLPRHLLPAFYAAATVVAYPSLYEGFGLPPVEAMACGAAVVGYSIPPLEESLHDAAVLTPPGDVTGLSNALSALARDEERRRSLRTEGLRLVGEMSWKKAAAATASVYRSLGICL